MQSGLFRAKEAEDQNIHNNSAHINTRGQSEAQKVVVGLHGARKGPCHGMDTGTTVGDGLAVRYKRVGGWVRTEYSRRNTRGGSTMES